MGGRTDVLQGTLDMLILKALTPGPMHGWGVSRRIQEASSDVLQVNQGSLYPALHRLQYAGWIESEWGVSEAGRRAKFYHLTGPGRGRLEKEKEEWRVYVGAVEAVLQAT
ncbi:MAG TPA: PadR family transcriptional regulator [Longimicrobiales bacterium]|nr:PadR family transcriptional regulator [Longimicrobiales bacterium]